MPLSRASVSFFAVFRMPVRMSSTPAASGFPYLSSLTSRSCTISAIFRDRLVSDPEGLYEHLEGAELADMGKFSAAHVEGHESFPSSAAISRSSMKTNEAFGSINRLMSQADAMRSMKGFFRVAQIFP